MSISVRDSPDRERICRCRNERSGYMVSTCRELVQNWGEMELSGRMLRAVSPDGSLWPAEMKIVDDEDLIDIGGNICAI
ncbi:hypothetical protein [Methanothrix sp.]|uniref:hypothetical protein n=1 Tax=Methanothrix sp. TaxID=90426 RepID=UPI003C719645